LGAAVRQSLTMTAARDINESSFEIISILTNFPNKNFKSCFPESVSDLQYFPLKIFNNYALIIVEIWYKLCILCLAPAIFFPFFFIVLKGRERRFIM
jgi:hypothetical protein